MSSNFNHQLATASQQRFGQSRLVECVWTWDVRLALISSVMVAADSDADPSDIVMVTFTERHFFIDNLLVRIHLIIKMTLVDRPRAMGV